MKHLAPILFSLSTTLFAAIALSPLNAETARPLRQTLDKPNIVVILSDDVGWGDISANQPSNKFKTPAVDQLAQEGMRFTNAHAPHAVCTPTRYSLLTGRYCWRTFLREGVLPGYSKPLIPTTRMTLASLCKEQGYTTGAFGKWHIGLGWKPVEGDPGDFHYGSQIHAANQAVADISKRVNHFAPIEGGPTDIGFDTFFGTPSNRSRIPVFMRDDRIVGSPTRDETGLMRDPEMRGDTVDDLYVDEAIAFMERSVKQKKPFFVYLPINAAHGAVSVPKEFQGKSGVSSRADKVLWVNKSVRRITESLAKLKQDEDTLLIFTSDNGPFAARGSDLKEGHDASGPYRGFKTDAWDGGTRVPFIVRWPGKVKPSTTNDELLSLTDIMATLSSIFDTTLPDWAGEDSFDQLPNFLGEANAGRESMITQSYTGILSVRDGRWKLILDTKGSGGFYRYSPEVQRHTTMSPWRPDMSDTGQLYDIQNDPYETSDVFEQHPEVVDTLKNQLRSYINSGRTRPL
ncbi:MAG: arylsulfatase [Opitutaceae bacterium]|nr:arylsulfatase [Opitutaceae bacterium]